MKLASKIFLIIGMVSFPLYAILLFTTKEVLMEFFSQNVPDLTTADIEFMDRCLSILPIMMVVYSVIALVVGGISLYKLNNAKTKNELVACGILSLLFVSLLGGIFMLCVKNEDLNAGRTISLSETPDSSKENSDQN